MALEKSLLVVMLEVGVWLVDGVWLVAGVTFTLEIPNSGLLTVGVSAALVIATLEDIKTVKDQEPSTVKSDARDCIDTGGAGLTLKCVTHRT